MAGDSFGGAHSAAGCSVVLRIFDRNLDSVDHMRDSSGDTADLLVDF